MRICLLGEFKGKLDEGMRKTSFNILNLLKEKHEVLSLDLREIFKRDFWSAVKSFEPDLIHYLHGSSFRSFLVLRMIFKMTHSSKSVMSIMRLMPSSILRFASLLNLKPDLLLVPSKNLCEYLKKIKIRAEFFPLGGVDLEKFRPVSETEKESLREKYGIEKERFVILHVGHVKRGRNVLVLKELQGDNNQVVVVGSTSTKADQDVLRELQRAGCKVWRSYFEKIEEIYAMADCYVFPTKSYRDAVQLPLSVLEAMACNLPVITTKFGSLPHLFSEGDGLIYAETEDEFVKAARIVREIEANTRSRVEKFGWKEVVRRLENIYSNLKEI
jgi:glycosyltransferase involved in cell wall biosynthesis